MKPNKELKKAFDKYLDIGATKVQAEQARLLAETYDHSLIKACAVNFANGYIAKIREDDNENGWNQK